MRLELRAAFIAGLVVLCGRHRAHAQPAVTTSAAAALQKVEDADPLELARVVRRYGDGAVLSLLASAQSPAIRLVAVRAAPWLSEPELALLPLAALIASRDSDLAEAAARASWVIARALDHDALARREISPRELSPAATALRQVARQPWLRADLQLLAAAAVAQLEAAGVPHPDAK